MPPWTHNIEARPGCTGSSTVLMSHRSSDESWAFGSFTNVNFWFRSPSGFISFTLLPETMDRAWEKDELTNSWSWDMRSARSLFVSSSSSSIALDMNGDSRIAITFLAMPFGSSALYVGLANWWTWGQDHPLRAYGVRRLWGVHGASFANLPFFAVIPSWRLT